MMYKISRGILRNSRNNQWTVGLLSKAFYKVNKDLKTIFWFRLEISTS